jgi:hypothetical protein
MGTKMKIGDVYMWRCDETGDGERVTKKEKKERRVKIEADRHFRQ